MKNNLPAAIKILLLQLLLFSFSVGSQAQNPPFKVLVVASADPDHDPMIKKSSAFFEKLAAENNFKVDFTRDGGFINDENLSQYKVLVQLHLAPFDMTSEEQEAMQHFITRGGGWVGVHAAGLTGKQFIAPETPYWQWFEKLMGGI